MWARPARKEPAVTHDPPLLPTLPAALHPRRGRVHHRLPRMPSLARTDHQPASARSASVSSDRRTSPTSCPTQPPARSHFPSRKRDRDRPAHPHSPPRRPPSSAQARRPRLSRRHRHTPRLHDGVNTSSERPPGPERTSPTPTHDGTTKDSSNPLTSTPTVNPLSAYSSAKRPPPELSTPLTTKQVSQAGNPSDSDELLARSTWGRAAGCCSRGLEIQSSSAERPESVWPDGSAFVHAGGSGGRERAPPRGWTRLLDLPRAVSLFRARCSTRTPTGIGRGARRIRGSGSAGLASELDDVCDPQQVGSGWLEVRPTSLVSGRHSA